MIVRTSLVGRLLASGAAIACLCGVAHAADAPVGQDSVANSSNETTGLSDIVVTATRRATNVQDVPIAITAVSGAQLESKGIADAVQLSRVTPNLFATTGYASGNPRFAIRGLGSTDFSQGGSSPVAVYVDDVYQPYSFGVGSQLFDLDRVEVLRGPQGTLFGKNTTGGAVEYFAAKPSRKTEGYINVDGMWGQYGKYAGEGMFNTPLGETLAARFDLRYEHRDAYVDNVYNGGKLGKNDTISGRIQLRWTPTEETSVNLKIFGMYSNGDATIYHGGFITNICDPNNFQPVNTPYANCNGSNLPPTYQGIKATSDETHSFERYHNFGATLRIEQALGDWNLTAITGYQKINYKIQTNDDGNSTDFFHSRQDLRTWQISQEVRVATPADRPISAIIGIFGQHDRAITPTATGVTKFTPPFQQLSPPFDAFFTSDYVLRSDGDQKTDTLAAFTNVTWKATDKLSFIGGLRYSYEHKKINLTGLDVFSGTFDFTDANMVSFNILNPPFAVDPNFDTYYFQNQKNSWKRLTWDATVNYHATDDVLLYAKIAEGFRSGGYNLFASFPSSISTVNPEILRSYEVGLKSELLDRKLRLNVAGFYYDLKNEQIQTTGGVGAGIYLSNAGAATIKGFEVEAEWVPLPRLHLNASLGYTDAKFDQFDTFNFAGPISLKGNQLPYAPKWTATAEAGYDIPLQSGYKVTLNSDWNYRTKVYFDAFNEPYTGDGALLMGNARVTLYAPEGSGLQWHLSAYVNNLTNKTYHTFAFFTGNAWYSSVYGDQRIWGLQAGIKF